MIIGTELVIDEADLAVGWSQTLTPQTNLIQQLVDKVCYYAHSKQQPCIPSLPARPSVWKAMCTPAVINSHCIEYIILLLLF